MSKFKSPDIGELSNMRREFSAPDVEELKKMRAESEPQTPGALESALRGAEYYGTLGLGDEINARLASLLPSGKSYEEELAESKANFEAAKEANPITYHGSGILSSLIPTGLAMKGIGAAANAIRGFEGAGALAENAGTIKKLANLVAQGLEGGGGLKGAVASNALVGAALGGAQGLGEADTLQQGVSNLPENIITGAELGGAGGAAFHGGSKLLTSLADTHMGKQMGQAWDSAYNKGLNLFSDTTQQKLAENVAQSAKDVSELAVAPIKSAGEKIQSAKSSMKNIDISPITEEFGGARQKLLTKANELAQQERNIRSKLLGMNVESDISKNLSEVRQERILNNLDLDLLKRETGKDISKYQDLAHQILEEKTTDPEKAHELLRWSRDAAYKLKNSPTADESVNAPLIEKLENFSQSIRNKMEESSPDFSSAMSEYSGAMKTAEALIPDIAERLRIDPNNYTDVEKDLVSKIKKSLSDSIEGRIQSSELDKQLNNISSENPKFSEAIKKLQEDYKTASIAGKFKSGSGLTGKARMLTGWGVHGTAHVANELKPITNLVSKVPTPGDLFKPEVLEALSRRAPTTAKILDKLKDPNISEAKKRAYNNILLNNPVVRKIMEENNER